MSYAVVAAAEDGEFWDEPDWAAAVRTGNEIRAPREEELIPLPEGARIQFLPGRTALGYWHGANECGFQGQAEALEGRLAVAAQLPSGFTRTAVPAFEHTDDPRYLPFFGFTAVVAGEDELLCAAVRTDSNPHWEPHEYGGDDLLPAIRSLQKELEGNRILGQLEVCATRYGCYNAQNIFFGRWEGAVAVSPSCNAQCRGCISYQPEEFPPSPQERFHLVPTVDEVVQLGLHHLRGPEYIYSFGQGCEGEPLLQGELIAESVARIPSGERPGQYSSEYQR